jgi:hypothetical protein
VGRPVLRRKRRPQVEVSGPLDRYPDEASVTGKYHEFLATLNAPSAEVMPEVDPNDVVALFVELVYFPQAEKRLRGNTSGGYKGIWSALQARTQIGQVQTRMVRTPHVQAALDALAAASFEGIAGESQVFSDPGLRRGQPARIPRRRSQSSA